MFLNPFLQLIALSLAFLFILNEKQAEYDPHHAQQNAQQHLRATKFRSLPRTYTGKKEKPAYVPTVKNYLRFHTFLTLLREYSQYRSTFQYFYDITFCIQHLDWADSFHFFHQYAPILKRHSTCLD